MSALIDAVAMILLAAFATFTLGEAIRLARQGNRRPWNPYLCALHVVAAIVTLGTFFFVGWRA